MKLRKNVELELFVKKKIFKKEKKDES